MTRNPGPLQEVETLFESQICECWAGTVGDRNHSNGYHLGGAEVPRGDYSITSPRDINGVKLFGGDWAAAVDVGMEWPASRLWLTWAVAECKAGRMPDIAEIIGSVDGIQDWRWTAGDQFSVPEMWQHNHIEHSHISIFRDSIFRSHTYLFDTWTPAGTITKLGLDPRPVIPPVPYVSPPSSKAVPPGVKPDRGGELYLIPYVAAGSVLAWIIRRRREAGL